MMHLTFFLLLLISVVWSGTIKEGGAQKYMQDLDDDSKSRQSDTILVIIESFRTIHERLDMLERRMEKEINRFDNTIERQMNGLHKQLKDSDRKLEKVYDNVARNAKLIQTLSNACSKEQITTEKPSTASPATTSKEQITTEKPTTASPATTPKAVAAPLLLVANGRTDPGGCQLVDLSSNQTCKTIARYPLRVLKAAGSMIDGLPLICGGYDTDLGRATDDCYIYIPNIDRWNLHTRLPMTRRNHAAVTINDTIWISGGLSQVGGYKDYKSTLFVHRDGSVERGPDMPTAKGGHCVVDLQDGRYMVIGGDQGSTGNMKLKEVFIYNTSDGSFSAAPSLSIARSFHACAMFNSPLYEYRPTIVVAGGENTERTVEMLDFTNPFAVWEQHESLPSGHARYNSEAVVSGNNVYIRLEKSFYQLVWNTTAFFWRKTEQEMNGRGVGSFSVTMIMPSDYSCKD